MTSHMELRRLEQGLVRVRWFAVLFGVVGVAIQPGYPNRLTEQLAWGLIALLAMGNVAIWGGIGQARSDHDLGILGAGAYVFDSVIVMGAVWLFAFEDPYVTWALLIVIPMEGALRYRLRGALAAA